MPRIAPVELNALDDETRAMPSADQVFGAMKAYHGPLVAHQMQILLDHAPTHSVEERL